METSATFPTAPLSDLLIRLKDGTHGTHARQVQGVPLLSAKNITEAGLIWDADDDTISENDFRALDRSFSLQRDDLLLTVVGSLGRRALHDGSKVVFQRSVAFLRANRDRITPRYLFHVAGGTGFQCALVQRSNATAQAGVYLGELARIRIDVPPLPEQQQIAVVLDTIDQAIRKTEQIIAKLKQVKQGLLHDLLTRGIDHNGELRDPLRHPEQFMDSALGRIPREWEVGPFSAYGSPNRPHLKTGPFGSSLKQEHWVSEGVPVVTIGSLGEGDFIRAELLHISAELAQRLSAYALAVGDIVFSRVADVGRSVVVTGQEAGWIMSSNMMWISLDRDRVVPEYAQANIASNHGVRSQIGRLVNSSGRDVANAAIMNQLLLPWAPTGEQAHLVSQVNALDLRARSEKANLSKLILMKTGLMEDLLTGRVRVTPLLEALP